MAAVEPSFDTIAAWWPCQPPPEAAVSNVVLSRQRDMQDFATKSVIEGAWTGAGGSIPSRRWDVYQTVHTLTETEITLPNGETIEAYIWNSMLWLQRVAWYDTPGVNRVYCVQRLYPNSPVGFTLYPPPSREE